MSIYYVTRPGLKIDALVDAPSTEKARTAFLDYLERSRGISRSNRGKFRINMIAEKMEDPYSAQAQITLRYGGGYEPEPVRMPLGEQRGLYDREEQQYEEGPAYEEEPVYQEPTVMRSPLDEYVRQHPIM